MLMKYEYSFTTFTELSKLQIQTFYFTNTLISPMASSGFKDSTHHSLYPIHLHYILLNIQSRKTSILNLLYSMAFYSSGLQSGVHPGHLNVPKA